MTDLGWHFWVLVRYLSSTSLGSTIHRALAHEILTPSRIHVMFSDGLEKRPSSRRDVFGPLFRFGKNIESHEIKRAGVLDATAEKTSDTEMEPQRPELPIPKLGPIPFENAFSKFSASSGKDKQGHNPASLSTSRSKSSPPLINPARTSALAATQSWQRDQPPRKLDEFSQFNLANLANLSRQKARARSFQTPAAAVKDILS